MCLVLFIFILASYTYENSGSQNVKSTTAGGERVKLSLAFTAIANGLKLPILVVLPRKNPLKSFVCPHNIMILYKPKSKTFDTQVMKKAFINNILRPFMLRYNKRKILLHLDNSPVHKRKDLLKAFYQNKVELSFFPPRMTSLLQPADVSWFRSLKAQYHNKWQEWYLTEPKSFTKSNNMKSPGYGRVIQWISQIWAQFDSKIIVNSFASTGITSQHPDDFNPILRAVLMNKLVPSKILDDNR